MAKSIIILKSFESLKKESELEPFSDEEDIFTLKTFEISYMWAWDVANETCAICRSSLMEVSPNQMVSFRIFQNVT